MTHTQTPSLFCSYRILTTSVSNIRKAQWNPFLNYKRVTYKTTSDVRLRKVFREMNFRRFLERSLDERDKNDRSVNIFKNCY